MFSSFLKASLEFYSNSRQLIRSSTFFFLMNVAGVVLNFLFAMIAGNYYGSEVWGKFALCLSILQIVCIPCRLGLDTLSIRLTAEEHTNNTGKIKDIYIKTTTMVFIASLFMVCILFFLSDYIAVFFFNKPGIAHNLKITFLAIIPFNLLFLNSESMKGIKFPVSSSFFRNVSIWIFSLSALLFAQFFLKKQFTTEVYIISVFISWGLSSLIFFKQISFFNTIRDKWIDYKNLLIQGIPMMFSNSLIYLLTLTDILMLGMFRTEAEVGIYNMAFRISVFLALSTVAVTGVFAPEFAIYNSKNDREGLQTAIGKANRIIFWTTLPPAILIFIFSIPLLEIFGKEFVGGNIALIFLAAAKLFASFAGARGFILPMMGKQKAEQYISMIIVIINILLNLFLIPRWGINGAGMATMITAIVWTGISVVYLRSVLKINALYIPFLGKYLKI